MCPVRVANIDWKVNSALGENVKLLRPPLHSVVRVHFLVFSVQQLRHEERIEVVRRLSPGGVEATKSLIAVLEHPHKKIDYFIIQPRSGS
jgi:hypothetical protein